MSPDLSTFVQHRDSLVLTRKKDTTKNAITNVTTPMQHFQPPPSAGGQFLFRILLRGQSIFALRK